VTSRTIKPKKEILELRGKLTYSESLRAWSIARFKPPLIREFCQLKDRKSRYNYKLKLCWTHKELEREIRKIKKLDEAIPILLHFEKV
jgi:hypothetical protein